MDPGNTRQLNEMDRLFYSHSLVGPGVYRFAGCFECALDDLSLEELRAAIDRIIELYPEVLLADADGPRAARLEQRSFRSEATLEEFYRASLADPVDFGNVLLRATIIDKPDGERALFLLIPHFAGDSKIAAFVLGRLLCPDAPPAPPLRLSVVTYRDLARRNIRGAGAWIASVCRELVEMAQSFALWSPAKGRMGVATVFLEQDEVRGLNGRRRELALSRSHLLQVAALCAYRTVTPPPLARVFNIIFDNSPAEPTVSNCFRSMPLVLRRGAACADLASCRTLFTRLTSRYASAASRHAFVLRSLLVSILPLRLLRRVLLRSTRGVQHYISYVYLDGKLHLPPRPGGRRVWGNIEPVGHALSNFNAVELDKQISLNLTWDTRSLGPDYARRFFSALRDHFRPRGPGPAPEAREQTKETT